MEAWTDPAWLADAHGWIERCVDGRLTGPIEQPHVREWSTVMRTPTSEGVLWFKANAPAFVYEAGVVDVLARRCPAVVPELVAIDRARGWMLMRHGGERLREIIEEERDLSRWLDVLPQYAELQLALADDAEELVALGAPDRRLAALPAQFEQLLAEVEGLDAEERTRLDALVPVVDRMCGELAALGIPETIQHDDLHDAQVFVRDGRYLFFDWGDSCVSHPFFSMAVTLEGQLAWGLDDVEGSVDVTPFRDAYLRPFASFAARPELEVAHAAALRLGWICRALNVHRFGISFGPGSSEEWLERVRLRLRMTLAQMPPRG